MTLQPYIDLGWHTVPLKGTLERLEDGSKTIPHFEPDWRAKYQKEKNAIDSKLGGTITGEVSGIIAVDCDNENTWKMFRALDPEYEFVLLSKGKGYPAGTLVYKYDHDLANTFSINNGAMALDFYSDRGFIYLATKANKTKIPIGTPLPEVREMPPIMKIMLMQFYESTLTKVDTGTSANLNVMTANCLNPTVRKFVEGKGEFMPGLFKVITPRDFRASPAYIETGYLHPNAVPEGRGSEYLMKVSAILGADISVDEELYTEAMIYLNDLFDEPLPQKRLDATIMDPMLNKKASIEGKPIWQYVDDWDEHRLILQGKRQTALELAFDDNRDMYYVVDSVNQKVKTFTRDNELMAYVEAVAISAPKKIEVKRSLPIVNTMAVPNLPFGFNVGNDATARLLNTFVQTPELMVFNDPGLYVDKYKRPDTILRYLEDLVPDDTMREYLLRFVKTKLSTFSYSPVILYFMGVHGSGKDIFVGILEQILGHVARPTTKEFLEMFNAWMTDTYIVQLDEYGNQLTAAKDRDEALGKLKAYTGKQKVQIRRMRTDGFSYMHNVTFIMTANKNPLMLEDGDRRIAFFQTPNKMDSLGWVKERGGVAEVYHAIHDEVKDFCYYLATEVQSLTRSEYVMPPESDTKHELIANSMYAAQRLAYVLKHNMIDYLIDLAESYEVDQVVKAARCGDLTTLELYELYDEMTEGNGNHRNLYKVLKNSGFEMRQTTRNGEKAYKLTMHAATPFEPDVE